MAPGRLAVTRLEQAPTAAALIVHNNFERFCFRRRSSKSSATSTLVVRQWRKWSDVDRRVWQLCFGWSRNFCVEQRWLHNGSVGGWFAQAKITSRLSSSFSRTNRYFWNAQSTTSSQQHLNVLSTRLISSKPSLSQKFPVKKATTGWSHWRHAGMWCAVEETCLRMCPRSIPSNRERKFWRSWSLSHMGHISSIQTILNASITPSLHSHDCGSLFVNSWKLITKKIKQNQHWDKGGQLMRPSLHCLKLMHLTDHPRTILMLESKCGKLF